MRPHSPSPQRLHPRPDRLLTMLPWTQRAEPVRRILRPAPAAIIAPAHPRPSIRLLLLMFLLIAPTSQPVADGSSPQTIAAGRTSVLPAASTRAEIPQAIWNTST